MKNDAGNEGCDHGRGGSLLDEMSLHVTFPVFLTNMWMRG
jgi:hypothetical protein